jgi:hypothetical protein
MIDKDGRIQDLVNSTHPTPEKLIGLPLQSIFVDGFTERFNQLRDEVLSGSGPKECLYIVNSRGCLEVRRCKMLKAHTGLIVLSHVAEHLA